MNKRMKVAALSVLLCASASSALAAATVTFSDTEKMSDVPRFQSDREWMVEVLTKHFDELSRRLPAGQELKVEVLDIDLAGEVFPRVAIRDVRVMKGRADYPRIHLRYRIEQDGQVVRSGEERITNMNYLNGFNRYSQELFAHEKQMLDDWFRKDLVAAR